MIAFCGTTRGRGRRGRCPLPEKRPGHPGRPRPVNAAVPSTHHDRKCLLASSKMVFKTLLLVVQLYHHRDATGHLALPIFPNAAECRFYAVAGMSLLGSLVRRRGGGET